MSRSSSLARVVGLALAHTAAGAVAGLAAQGAGWSDFRGPTCDGHAAVGATAPLRWSEAENVRWKTAVHGRGWSTPVVGGGRVWLTTATGSGEKLSVLCIDVESGEVLRDFVLFEDDAPQRKKALAFCGHLIKHGVYFHPYHNMFLSTAHTEADIHQTLAATDQAFAALG